MIAVFCSLQLTLDHYFPEAKTNFDVWRHYFIINNAGYDTMLFFMAFVTFLNVKGVLKLLSCFLVIMTGGSFIDKVVFGLNQYLYSDLILIVIAVSLSIHFYFSKWKT